MGFYVRKGLSAGPFRFNLSKSGVGVSAGVPGFRIGTGPRGNYVHAGRGGVYYRKTLGRGRRARAPQAHTEALPPEPLFTPSDVVLHDVTGASALELISTSPDDLVSQLNAAAKPAWTAPWVPASVAVAVVALLAFGADPIVGVLVLVLAIPAFVWLVLRERARRSVVAFYDVNDEVAVWFQSLVDRFEELRSSERAWRVNDAGTVNSLYQSKIHGGASSIVSRTSASVSMSPPSVLKTNINVPSITAGDQALLFLPDRILVRAGNKYSDASYGDLETAAYAKQFIENERPPSDGKQVGTTWQYVNKNGGPDLRFNNNRQLPVMLYGRLELATRQGLFWILDISRDDVSERITAVLDSAPASLR